MHCNIFNRKQIISFDKQIQFMLNPQDGPPANQAIQVNEQNNIKPDLRAQANNDQYIRNKWHEFIDEQQDEESLKDDNEESVGMLAEKREKSLKESLEQTLNENQETLAQSIRLRYVFRVIVLLIITLGLLKIFRIIKDDLAFYHGLVELTANINLQVQNCHIMIEDAQFSQIQKRYKSFFKNGEKITFEDDQKKPKILLEYSVPGRFNIDPLATVSTVNVSQGFQSFINILSSQNCMIKIFIFEKILISNMNLNCSKSCYLVQKSANITYQDININGDLIESNFKNLEANNINYHSTQGRFQGNRVMFTNFSNINIESGDIIVQTDQEIQLNWTHAIPNYCFSAPAAVNPIVIDCQMPKEEDINNYLTGLGSQRKEEQKVQNNDEISEESEEERAGEENMGEEDSLSIHAQQKLKTFFEDDGGDTNIFILDQLPNYQQTINYQNVQKKIQQQLAKGSKKKLGNLINLNIHVQNKKVIENQDALLFKPSCYGSILLCQSKSCSDILSQYSKSIPRIKRKNQKNKNKNRILKKLQKFQDFKAEEELSEKDKTQGEEEEEETQNVNESDKKKSNTKDSYDKQARRMLPHEKTEGIPFLNLTGRFGNIYVNIINQSIIVNDEQSVVFGSAYSSQNVNFSIPSIKKILDAHQDSKNPHNLDPSFIFGIGSKESQSDNYQQWQLTYNPAYSYLRPWWIGTFSFTLLSTSTHPLELQLSPGFCPYIPTLDIRHLYKTGQLINGFFQEAEHSINTYSIQDGLKMPIIPNVSTDGFKQYISDNNVEEKWYQISKTNETNYKLLQIDLMQSPATEWAVKVSILLSIITALILLTGLSYIIIQVYDSIVIQVESIKKYGDIEQKDEDLDKQQPLMDIKEKQQKESPVDKKNANQQVQFTFNPLKMSYFLLVKAPPLSAFIDYLLIMITKKFRNSAKEFYSHLFEEKDLKQDSNDVESMLSFEFKTLYEKFCYLNGFLEQKLDDNDNIEYLKKYGFFINEHDGAQTECTVRVLLDKMVKLTEIPQNKTSYQLFIEQCCRLTKFEQDCLTLQTFNEKYDEFCLINHLQREIISNIQLKEYNIETKFIPIQYVERINKSEYKQKNEVEAEAEAEAEIKWYKKQIKAQKQDLCSQSIEIRKSFLFDNGQNLNDKNARRTKYYQQRNNINTLDGLFGIFSQFYFIFQLQQFMIIPLFSFTVLERVLYYPYSLIPINNLISKEDIFHNIWLIPDKLQQESTWIRNILILIIIYWIYSIIDLIYYYINMDFPQEKFFSKTQKVQTNKLQFIFRQIMWILVLYSAFQLFFFISLAGVWMVLGGIVDPQAFLPYATAATFITVIISKASQYKAVAEEGFHVVIEYVEKLSNDQFAGLLKKYEINQKINKVLDNQIVEQLADAALEMGLADQDIINEIKLGINKGKKSIRKGIKEKLQLLQEDPQSFFDKLKSDAQEAITTQISKQINIFGGNISRLITAITDEKIEEIQYFILQIFSEIKKEPIGKQFESLNEETLPLIFQLAETFTKSENNNTNSFIQPLLSTISKCLSYLILDTIPKENQKLQIDRKNLEYCILKSFQIESNLQQFKNNQQIYNNFQEILSQQGQNQEQFKLLSKFSGLLQLTVTLFEGKRESVPINLIIQQIQTYFFSQNEFKEMKDILGYFELVLNSFKKQIPLTSAKQISEKIEQFYQFSIQKFKQNEDQKTIQKIKEKDNVSLVTLWFSFIYNNFDKVPQNIIQEYITQISQKEENQFLNQFIKEEGDSKKFIDLVQNMFNMMTLFMDRPSETKKIYQNSQYFFQIDEETTKTLIYFLQFSSKMKLTQENSKKENDLVKQFSETKQNEDKYIITAWNHLNKFQRPEFQFLLDSISSIQKIDIKRVRQFFSLIIIYLTDNEQYLSDAVENLRFPKEYFYFMLNIKKKETIPYFYDSLKKLGFKDSQIQEMKNCSNDKDRFNVFMRIFMDCYKSGNDWDLLYNFSELQYQKESLKFEDELARLSNNENKFLLLTNQEIKLAKQIIKLGGIKFEPTSEQLVLNQKQSIQELSSILNINKDILDDYVNLLFINNTNQTIRILKTLQDSQDAIKITKEKQFEQFINYISCKTLLLNKKQEKLKSAVDKIIPQGLPYQLINKILINKYQSIDIATFFNCSKLLIPSIEDNGQDYINKLNPIIKFMTNTIQLTDTEQIREFFNKKDLFEGTCNFLKIQSETNLTKKFQYLIEHLQFYQIKHKNDKDNNVPQFFLTQLCLYLFFRGKHQQLYLLEPSQQQDSVIDQNQIKTVNTLQYLNIKYNLAPEFFQSIHAIFLKDKQQFIQVMIKFNRKYQQLKILDQNESKQIVPLQSLFKVQESLIMNLINLLDGDFQPNYFAKLLKLNQQLLDFIAALSKIKIHQDDLSQKRIQINNLQKSYQPAFDKLQLDSQEFTLIISLLYQDLSPSQFNLLIQKFGLESKINQSTLLNLMHIDRPFPLKRGKKECLKEINFDSNNLINQWGLNRKIVSTSKILINGAISLLDKVFHYYPQFSSKSNQQLEIVKSLVSCISGQLNDSNINLKEFTYSANEAINNQNYIPEFVKDTFNGQEYAIFMLNKYFLVEPEYILLLNGQESFWRMVQTVFSGTYQEQIAYRHPLIILESFLVFYNIPLVMKKIITDYEYKKYLKKINKEFYNKDEKLRKPTARVKKTEYHKLIKSIYQDQLNYVSIMDILGKMNISNSSFEYDEEKGQKVLELQQNRAIFECLPEIKQFLDKKTNLKQQFEFLLEQIQNNEDQYRNISYEQLIDQILKNEDQSIRSDMKEMKPFLIFSYQKKSIYKLTDSISYFKRDYQIIGSSVFKQNESYLILMFFTELFSLRNIYNYQSNIAIKTEDLQKIVVVKLDLIISFIERFFFFQDFVESMSKNSLIQLLGLSAGFVLTAEDIIKARLTEQLFDYSFSQTFQKQKLSTQQEQIKYKYKFMLEVYEDSVSYDKKKTKYYYNKIYNQAERLIQHPENFFTPQQNQRELDFKDFFLDLPMLTKKSEIYKYLFINGKQISLLKDKHIENEIQVFLSMQDKKDPKSGLEWQKKLLSVKNWGEHTQKDNLKLIIAILKRNYQFMVESNSVLMEKPISAQIYQGIIALQGAQQKAQQGLNQMKMSQLQQYFNSFALNCKSNKKVLLELLSIFVGCFDKIRIEFIILYKQHVIQINQYFYDINHIKQLIFPQLQLLQIDEDCLEYTLRVYAGDASLFNLIGNFNKVLLQKKINKATDALIMKKRQQKIIEQYDLNLNDINQQKKEEKYYGYKGKSYQLLESFNPNYYHRLQNLDFNQIDFFKYLIQLEGDVFEYIYLMAQHLTKETDFEIFQFRVMLNFKDPGYQGTYFNLLRLFYTDIINNDIKCISFEKENPITYCLVELLTSMKLIQNQDEFQIVKGIYTLQTIYQEQKLSDELLDKQLKIVNNLNLTKLENEDERNQIEKLYIGLCQNQFSFIYASILKFNKLQAANLLSIFYMKNFNGILRILGQKNYQFIEENIIHHIIIFQLNIYSKTLGILSLKQKKLNNFSDQRKLIIDCTYQILRKIDQLYYGKDPSDEIRKIKQKLKETISDSKTQNFDKNFSWSHWIINYPKFNDSLDKYVGVMDPSYQGLLSQSKNFFKILMGVELHETVKQGDLFQSTLINYEELSKIFSYPMLLDQQVDYGHLFGSYMNIFKQKMNHEQLKYINLFDQFIKIIIQIQVP
ncbi:hypothetical protein pb186bvf_001544, partial [Paramecium bursaria]